MKDKKGKILKGSITHKVCEAILTRPEPSFTSAELWEDLKESIPDLKRNTVSGLLTNKKNMVVRELFEEEKGKGRAKIYTRYDDAEMPPLWGSDISHGSYQLRKTKPPKKLSTEMPPETVTTDQIAKSFIYYIERLKEKIRDLGISLADQKSRSATNLNLLRQEVKAQKVKIEKLEQENQSLRKLQRSNHSTFNMSEIARFTRNG